MNGHNLCITCANSVWCPTWGEVKCLVKERRYSPGAEPSDCTSYKKLPKDFKERKCQCEDCLSNEMIFEKETEL